MPNLVIDAYALVPSLGRQPQSALVPSLPLVLTQLGHVRNAIHQGTGASVVCDYWDASVQRPLDRLS